MLFQNTMKMIVLDGVFAIKMTQSILAVGLHETGKNWDEMYSLTTMIISIIANTDTSRVISSAKPSEISFANKIIP